MARIEATPNPAILIWARQTAGMSVEVAAQKAQVKAEQISSWEGGTASPTIPQLGNLAAVYHRPLAAFCLPEAPPKFQVRHGFRRLSLDNTATDKSPALVYEIRKAYDRREWTLDLMADIEESLQRKATRRMPERRDFLFAAGGPGGHREMAGGLQHVAPALGAGLQAAGAGGL